MPAFTFRKAERLKSRKLIAALFKEGNSFVTYPLRVVWVKAPLPTNEFPIQFTLSVPRRRFRKASQRNVLRRRIRNAYRLHKHQLYQTLEGRDEQFAMMFLYVGKEPLPYSSIEKAAQKAMKRLQKAWAPPAP